MIWGLAIVVVGLIAVMAELLLSYQRRSQDLRMRQEPIRRRIRDHTAAMQQAVTGIQDVASEQVTELTGVLTELNRRGEELADTLSRLERYHFGEGFDPRAPEKQELIEEEEEHRVDAEEDPKQMLREARDFHRLEVDGHRLSLQRDVEVMRRTLSLLETKLRRGAQAPSKGR